MDAGSDENVSGIGDVKTFLELPGDVVAHITRYLSAVDVATLSITCKRLSTLLDQVGGWSLSGRLPLDYSHQYHHVTCRALLALSILPGRDLATSCNRLA